jgi:hypothetical protein
MQMVLVMKGIGIMIVKTSKASSNLLMEISMKDISIRIS